MLRLMGKLAVVIFIFASCGQQDESFQYATVAKSLKSANETITVYTAHALQALESKSNDLQTATKAGIWKPRANTVHALTNEMLGIIDSLKNEIRNPADKLLFTEKIKARHLFNRLVNYKQRILETLSAEAFEDNPFLQKNLRDDSLSISKKLAVLRDTSVNAQEWLDSTFSESNALLNLAMLEAIESNILVSENLLVNHFNNLTVITYHGFDYFYPVATLNSSYLKPGDTIEVVAGLGAFTTSVKPIITIDGKKKTITPDGVAIHSFRAANKPGRYRVRVKFEYIKLDGSSERVTKNCYYTVAQ